MRRKMICKKRFDRWHKRGWVKGEGADNDGIKSSSATWTKMEIKRRIRVKIKKVHRKKTADAIADVQSFLDCKYNYPDDDEGNFSASKEQVADYLEIWTKQLKHMEATYSLYALDQAIKKRKQWKRTDTKRHWKKATFVFALLRRHCK